MPQYLLKFQILIGKFKGKGQDLDLTILNCNN